MVTWYSKFKKKIAKVKFFLSLICMHITSQYATTKHLLSARLTFAKPGTLVCTHFLFKQSVSEHKQMYIYIYIYIIVHHKTTQPFGNKINDSGNNLYNIFLLYLSLLLSVDNSSQLISSHAPTPIYKHLHI